MKKPLFALILISELFARIVLSQITDNLCFMPPKIEP